jgi:hypothetical protein
LIIYLLFRSFANYANRGNVPSEEHEKRENGKKISKDTGEFIDYEEMKK